MKRLIGIVFLLLLLVGCSPTIHCPICGFDFDLDDAKEVEEVREARTASLKE